MAFKPSRRVAAAAAIIVLAGGVAAHPDTSSVEGDSIAASHAHLTLGVGNTGISFGNARRANSIHRMSGLSVGLVNVTRELDGVQIGLLNDVAENPAPFKLLPIVNARLH